MFHMNYSFLHLQVPAKAHCRAGKSIFTISVVLNVNYFLVSSYLRFEIMFLIWMWHVLGFECDKEIENQRSSDPYAMIDTNIT
jgi:hypothetical protein